ncbi:MAG: N-acetyltransferase [Methyloceanibacter sp.]|uniref:GNAT family N-acetyltransferase n=1 Tax=Methyloceanibacter sp. TaxID=1965321 RepID=UPI003C5BA8BA
MIKNVEIRQALPADAPAIEALYPAAFPDEDLVPLVRDLQELAAISFVGLANNGLVAHAAFTPCSLAGRGDNVALLGPVAVAPDRQRQGIGSALLRAGLRHLQNAGTGWVFVLGDPGYYGCLGFKPDDDVRPPYRLPEEWRGAWQSLSLSEHKTPLRDQLTVPQAWRRQALWTPYGL